MSDPNRPVTGYPASTAPNGHTTATGTAYPYAAPPPNPAYYPPHQNPYYPAADPYAAQRATFIRRIFAILVSLVVVTCTIIFIVWLVLRPRVPEFRVDSLAVTDFNLSTNNLITGNWDVRVTARNPNSKIKLYYDHVSAEISYKTAYITEATVPPFVQGTKNETAVRVTFAVVNSYVDNRAVNGINGDRGRGSVGFTLRMRAWVRFKAGGWRARRRVVRVLCSNIPVGLLSNSKNGSLIGGSRECRVGL